MECLLGKACAITGNDGDGTAFSSTTIDDIGTVLASHGWDACGSEVMTSGLSGERMHMRVFMGPTYYQRLKHMVGHAPDNVDPVLSETLVHSPTPRSIRPTPQVADKMHSRNTGPVQSLTRQPMEGRSRGGGLRFGEMERDAVIAHGASHVLHDRLLLCSDLFRVYVCKLCGGISDPPSSTRFGESSKGRMPYCRTCDSSRSPAPVEIPYAMKLLIQELTALHMRVAMRIKPVE